MVTEEQWQKRCEELFNKELDWFLEGDIGVRANYLPHPKIHSLDIFIAFTDIEALIFVKYKFDHQNREVIKREQFIATAGAGRVLRQLFD